MISAFKDEDAVIQVDYCDGIDELFVRLVIKNETDKFVFHLTKEQANKLKESLK